MAQPATTRIADAGERHENGAHGGSSETFTAEDSALLDAYSSAVVRVTDAVKPAVPSIAVRSGKRQGGSGSGVILTPDGFLATNHHVVAGADTIDVRLIDAAPVAASLIGSDPMTDLAILRLPASDLPYARLGSSRPVFVGQLVIAIGNPLGFDSSVSTGVVSAASRVMPGPEGRYLENVIQHSAPLNPGNSGGPLIDSRADVVGINTSIIAHAQSIGFAIPAETLQWVLTEILAHGRVRRSYLGISVQTWPLQRRVIAALALRQSQAVLVRDCRTHSAAARAGVRAGDVILALDGQPTESVITLSRALTGEPTAGGYELELIRRGKRRTVRVVPTPEV